MTILEIKQERISDRDKLENINKEYAYLEKLLDELSIGKENVAEEVGKLKEVNEKLWIIEDDIHEK